MARAFTKDGRRKMIETAIRMDAKRKRKVNGQNIMQNKYDDCYKGFITLKFSIGRCQLL